MKLVLIANPFSYKLHEENLRIVQKYFGIFPPLSLSWVAAIAIKAGHSVSIIDARTLKLNKKEVAEQIKTEKADMIGFMLTTYMFQETLEWISYIKDKTNLPVVVGGYNLFIYPIESVNPAPIDFGISGSALSTIPLLLKEFEGGKRFYDVPGLIFKDNGKIVTVPENEEGSFNDYPFPARELLPNHLYAEFPTEKKNFTIMVTSKGCNHRCLFCEASDTSYDPRTPKLIVDEMEECYRKYNIREIDIFDYQFTADRKRVTDICNLIIGKKLNILWACRSRVDTVDYNLLRLMKKAGCGRIYFGIESGVQEILNRLNKKITLDDIRQTIGYTKEIGIRSLGFFLIGSPGETSATIKETTRFARELNLDYVQFSKLTAKPYTSLWKDDIKNGHRDYWRDYITGERCEAQLRRGWTSLSNDEIDLWTKKAYIQYHSRPEFLLRSIVRIRSLKEFKRKFYAYIDMLFSQETRSVKDKNFKAYCDYR